MKKEDIHFFDLKRWLFGNAPPEFLVEVLIRTLLIYIFLLVVTRLMGKRMSGQITITELAVVLTLGAIVSPVMQMPDKGIFFGIIVLTCAYLFQRGITLWGFKSEKVEKLTQGKMSLVVKDGELNLEELARLRISPPRLFGILRQKNIYNLGEIERAYWEACGICSVYKFSEPKPGLPTLPDFDAAVLTTQKEQGNEMRVCSKCGHIEPATNSGICSVCHSRKMMKPKKILADET